MTTEKQNETPAGTPDANQQLSAAGYQGHERRTPSERPRNAAKLTREHGAKVLAAIHEKVAKETQVDRAVAVAWSETLTALKQAVADGATAEDIIEMLEAIHPGQTLKAVVANTPLAAQFGG